ncbi:MAG: hypothetical protein HUK20_01950 [Fibrobacter sp.]|nr:hypothetical protein [Fibrobacter sp.]
MANELKILCDLLEGYSDGKRFEVTSAQKLEDGTWSLKVKKMETEAADDNQ